MGEDDMGELEAGDSAAPVTGSQRRDRSDKVAEKVARRILRDIVARAVDPETKLPSEALMLQRYKVGRASLREGLRILEVYGLIWIKPGPGGGPIVAAVNSIAFGRSATLFYHAVGATLRELVESWMYIEPLMARLASERLCAETAGRLRLALEVEHEEAGHMEASGDRPPHSLPFHNVIAGMSGNRVMGLVGQSIIEIYKERVRPVHPASDLQHLHDMHRDIGEAILRSNSPEAERLMRIHVEELAAQFANQFPTSIDEIIDWR